MDEEVVQTIRVDAMSPVAGFYHQLKLDLSSFEDGLHELFVQAYDVEGNPSFYDAFQAGSGVGEYMPTIINIQNNSTTSTDILASDTSIEVLPNPSDGNFSIKGQLADCDIRIVDTMGHIIDDLSTLNNEVNIDISALPDGMYFVHLRHKSSLSLSVEKILKF